ncbi:hypothetical protein [Intestinibacter sp.]|uniref:hypothetical protein n=1 Tax=Intestinibacter sp. TaxID=1965304 RepID=UPI002A762DDE|nr:hypothetical protein [Intestinibacter sp.]MDY2737773.1 hypothetical protein [Intestinibacter sp.]MDY4574316.1 hypothetical protein [Intestinibacter sp.]
MGKFNLSWTKYAPLEDEISIIDPLAFDYFAQLLGNVILPSFTTRTSRARYYSMVCYGIYISKKYLEQQGKPYYQKDLLDTFKIYEKYWARAIVEYYDGKLAERDGQEYDFRGKRGALKAYHQDLKSIGNEFKFLSRQLELGGLGAYRTSMESLELVDESLNLTHKGQKLARSFVDSYYDKLVLEAIKSKKLVEKKGKGSLTSFGGHTCLDGFKLNDSNYHKEERELLGQYILDNPKNVVSIDYIMKNYKSEDKLKTIEDISKLEEKDLIKMDIIEGYKTVLAFERLAISFNRIWCFIIRESETQFGNISLEQCAKICKDELDYIFEEQLINELITKKYYCEISKSYHGIFFRQFIENCLLKRDDYKEIIFELVKYHNQIMKKRNTSSWIMMDKDNLIVTAGYNYPKKTEKLPYLHGYKLSNIMSLIEDTGWKGK